jgi:hypothetical protein
LDNPCPILTEIITLCENFLVQQLIRFDPSSLATL